MNPIAFQIGSLTIHWYGVFVALGCLTGLWTASRRGALDGFPLEKAYDVGWWILLGAIVGARALYVITFWRDDFAGQSWIKLFNIRQGGLVFYGGLIGSSIAVLLYCALKKEPVWRLADMFAPSISLGSAFGRVGCLMTGCCFGSACSFPWAVHFPSSHATQGLPVHPTQIYDAAVNGLLYVLLEWAYRHKKFDGQIFAVWLLAYPFARSATELFRGDYPPVQLTAGLTPAQMMSIGIFIAGVLLYVLLPRQLSRRPRTSHATA